MNEPEQLTIISVDLGPRPAVCAQLMERECGCREQHDPEYDAWFLVSQCDRHAAVSAEAEEQIRRNSGYELDMLVAQANEGKRVERLRPRDGSKER